MLKLPEPILKHSVGVAEFMAEYAEIHGGDPHEYYVVGLLHDIGKLYPGDPDPEGKSMYKGHPKKGGELLKEMGFNYYKEILHHGHPEDGYFSRMWLVLNLADLSINGKGEKIPVLTRLKDIKNRYGKYSEEYEHASQMVDILIQNDIIRANGTIK